MIAFGLRHAKQIISDLDSQACSLWRSPIITIITKEKFIVCTDYSANAVACKLWGLVGSPTEFILALSVYHALTRSYEAWTCWVYSNEEVPI